MANLIQLTADLVSAHASNTQMTGEELYLEIEKVYASLKVLENGTSVDAPEQPKQLTMKQAFKKDSVTCMVCGKGGFKTLTRHLSKAHQMKPSQYKKEFKIPSSQSLTSKSYSDSRRSMAIEMNLGAGLVKGRAIRKANAEKNAAAVSPAVRTKAPLAVTKKVSVTAAKKTAAAPVVKKTMAPVPMIREKAPLPAVRVKAQVPVKVSKKK